jgi:hypothetical protein
MSFPEDDNPYATPAAVGTISALGSDQTLKRVATGLALVYWGIVIVLLSVVLAVFTGIAAQGAADVLVLFLRICSLGVILGIVVGFIGRVMCLAVPANTNAQSLIYGAVIFDLLALGIHIYDAISRSEVLDFLGNLCSLIAIILFVLFLKRVSEFVGRTDLADRAKSLIGLGLTTLLVAFLGGVIAVAAPIVLVLVGLGILVMALVMLVLYVRLLRDLRQAILAR